MMDAGISTYIRQYPAKFRQRSRRGIPDEFRWRVWKAAMQYNEQECVQDYEVLCKMENQWTKLIRADACNTFPAEQHFGANHQECLVRVLNAYANHNQNVGYCQGLNFIAGLLLLVSKDEKGAFGVLVSLMSHIGLSGFYAENQQLLHAYTSTWEKGLAQKMPELSAHFK